MDALDALLFSLDVLTALLFSFVGDSFLGDFFFDFKAFLVVLLAFSNEPGTSFLNLPAGRVLKAGTSE